MVKFVYCSFAPYKDPHFIYSSRGIHMISISQPIRSTRTKHKVPRNQSSGYQYTKSHTWYIILRSLQYPYDIQTSAGSICLTNPAAVGLDELAMPCFTVSLILTILHNSQPLQPGGKSRAPLPLISELFI